MAYMPEAIKRLNTPFKLLIVERYDKKNGVSIPIYRDANDPLIYCNFKTYGGTERDVDGRYVIEDTATVTTHYRPDISSDCKIVRLTDNATFEILNEPEDVEQTHRWLVFKVKRLKGKA